MNIAALEGAERGILCNAFMPNAVSRMAKRAGADWKGQSEPLESMLPTATGNALSLEFKTPLAACVASEHRQATHGLFSQCPGRIAHVFIGAMTGWQGPRNAPPSVEEVAQHRIHICDRGRGYIVPMTAGEVNP